MTNHDAVVPSAKAVATPRRSGSVKVYPLRDTATMLRRNLRQELRDKVAILAIIGIPVLFLLLFVYVFGGALTQSVKLAGSRTYVGYVLPGLIIMTAAAGLIGISTQTSADMTVGIIAGSGQWRSSGRPFSSRASRRAHSRPWSAWWPCSGSPSRLASAQAPRSWSGSARPGCLRPSPSPWPGWALPSASPLRLSLPRATGRSH